MIRQLLFLLFATVASAQPSGVFCVFGIDDNINTVAWCDSFVSGSAIEFKWSIVEAAQGANSWTYLDSAVAKAQSTGKKAAISMIAVAAGLK
jgi:hypothetical protein